MLSPMDREKLEASQQAVTLARQSVAELYKAENQLLAGNFMTIGQLSAIGTTVAQGGWG